MKVIVSPDKNTACEKLAEFIAVRIEKILSDRPYFNIILSGGSTPKNLYEILARDFEKRISWDRINVFWSDERYVPIDDDRSNFKMANEALLKKVKIPQAQVHPISTDISIQQSAENYADLLKEYFTTGSVLDLVLLGMGNDGHTLSLFPGAVDQVDLAKWVEVTTNNNDNTQRITLLPSIVNTADCVAFLVTGAEKAKKLAEVLGDHKSSDLPAAMIEPSGGEVLWFIDEAAASELDSNHLNT